MNKHTIFERFEKAFDDESIWPAFQQELMLNSVKHKFDIVIYKDDIPLAVVEIGSNLNSRLRLEEAKNIVRMAMMISGAKYGILTDGDLFYIIETSTVPAAFNRIEFDDVILQITDKFDVTFTQDMLDDIALIFKQAGEKYLGHHSNLLQFLDSQAFKDSIIFFHSVRHFAFDYEKETENDLFKLILGDFNDKRVCRYSGFDTVFSMLSYLSFRLNGIVGMNDKSEINYVDQYIENSITPLKSMHHKRVTAMNKRYITSCSEISRKDDLSLWRLYGDDAQGACMIFKIDQSKVNNHVLFRKVSYAKDDGSHPELQFLKEVIGQFEELTGFKFVFNRLGIWKHFFKPFEYKIEDEVRLLIIDKESLHKMDKGWVKTYSHSILNPYLDFELNHPDFPLHLEEIILGPKCPEQEINQIQFQELIRQKRSFIREQKKDSDISDLKVSLSDIAHYR